MIPVTIKTRPFIKSYLGTHMPGGIIDRRTVFGSYLLELLQKDQDHQGSRKVEYESQLTLCVSPDKLKRFGGWLNYSQTRYFNSFVNSYIKDQIRILIESHLYYDKRMCIAVDFALEKLGIAEEYNPDTAIKDFQRWRETQCSDELRIYNKKNVVYASSN